MGLTAASPSLNTTTPAEIAINAATHENQELCKLWFTMTQTSRVNPACCAVANQMRLAAAGAGLGQVADSLARCSGIATGPSESGRFRTGAK